MPWKCQTRSLKRHQAQGKKRKAETRQRRVRTPGRGPPTSAHRRRCRLDEDVQGSLCQARRFQNPRLRSARFLIIAVDHWEPAALHSPPLPCRGVLQGVCGHTKYTHLSFSQHWVNPLLDPLWCTSGPLSLSFAEWVALKKKKPYELRVLPLVQRPGHTAVLLVCLSRRGQRGFICKGCQWNKNTPSR